MAFSCQTRNRYIPETGMVLYKLPRFHKGIKSNVICMTALDLITRLADHIPRKGQKQIRYYGWVASRLRPKRVKIGEIKPLPAPSGGGSSSTWARMIRKVHEIDPLMCPRCGAEMEVIAFIMDDHVIRKILDHLELDAKLPVPAPSRAPPRVQEEIDWPDEQEPTEPDESWPDEEQAPAGWDDEWPENPPFDDELTA